ncbi:MAG: dihydroorotase [Bacteroidia bacterium]
MNILIKSATVVDPNSSHNGKKVDILIEKGIITEIRSSIKNDKNYKTIESGDLCVSPGWLDMQVNFRDPGFEYKEDLESGTRSAAQGGFTAVCLMPGTNPPLHSKSQIDYVVNKTRDGIVDVYPVGCISHNHEGKDIAEMYDMKQSGAVAFSDDKKALKDAGLVMRALQYSANVGSFIITHCDDRSISLDGKMHEGETSTRMGLKGIPALAEELMVQRNIAILEYAGGKMHLPTISTKASVELVKHAKAKGLQITAGVAAHNLFLDDAKLSDFDSNYKVNPPLRGKEDLEALKRGLLNGTIDVIVSDHAPEDTENKDLEFDFASDGIVALETAFAVANTATSGKMNSELLIEKFAINPRRILGLAIPQIKENEQANLTLFDPTHKWEFTKKQIRSKSTNTPFVGQTFTGKALGIINKNGISLAV